MRKIVPTIAPFMSPSNDNDYGEVEDTDMIEVIGTLSNYYETGTEGVYWVLERASSGLKKGASYEDLFILKEGDYLEIYDPEYLYNHLEHKILWSGIIKKDTESLLTTSHLNPNRKQQAVCGYWVHWLQDNFVDHEQWYWLFVMKYPAKLSRKDTSERIKWSEENKEAIQACKEFVEKNGLFIMRPEGGSTNGILSDGAAKGILGNLEIDKSLTDEESLISALEETPTEVIARQSLEESRWQDTLKALESIQAGKFIDEESLQWALVNKPTDDFMKDRDQPLDQERGAGFNLERLRHLLIEGEESGISKRTLDDIWNDVKSHKPNSLINSNIKNSFANVALDGHSPSAYAIELMVKVGKGQMTIDDAILKLKKYYKKGS